MAKALALAALALVPLLAGCAAPGEPPEAPAGAGPQRTYTTVVGDGREVVYTDTLHLLARPDLTTRPPPPGEPLRIPIAPFVAQSAQVRFEDWWDYRPAADQSGLAGEWVVWAEVAGTVTRNPNPLAGGCFWNAAVIVGDGDTAQYHGLPCVTEPATVPPGVRELRFPFDVAVELRAGAPVHFELHVQDVTRSPDARVDILTASAERDSRIQVAGLRLPVGSLLLPAT